MNNKSMFMIAFAIISILSSCGSDDECLQADWVGTYNLEEGHMCPDPSVSLDTRLTIEAGADANSFLILGQAVTFNECKATGPFGVTLELDGDKLNVVGLGCPGQYIRQ